MEPFSENKKNKLVFNTKSPEETVLLAEGLGKILHAADVIALYGDLGSGKTVFTSGIASALGIKGPIPSPTFTILIEHKDVNLSLYHFDAYRLTSEDDFYGLGFEEYFYAGGVCIIEWASNIPGVFPSHTIHVTLQRDSVSIDPTSRTITLLFPPDDSRINDLAVRWNP